MKTNIGEEGTEQFTVTTRVNGKLVAEQPIHDPFLHTRITHRLSRWDAFKHLIFPKPMVFEVSVDGSEGIQRVIMALDPIEIQKETDEIREARRRSRDESGVMGYYAEATGQ